MSAISRIGPHPIAITRFTAHHAVTRLRQRRLRRIYKRAVASSPAQDLRGMPVELPAADELPEELLPAAAEIRREADAACDHIVDLLGSGPTDLGDSIDWHEDFKSGYRWPEVFYQDVQVTRLDDASDAKAPWELSRGHHLLALARAAVLFREDRYASELEDQLSAWIGGNPVGVGINWTNAMEAGLRAANWVWAVGTLEQWRPIDSTLRQEVACSLGAHGRHIERNLEGTPWVRSNHYMADLVGLMVLGWALPDDPRSVRWLRIARRGFEREIVRQVHEDGVGFEASLAYHGLVLEMLLIAAWIAHQAAEPFSPTFYERLAAMVTACRALRHPDGRAPQIGDTDSGRVLPATSARPATHDHVIWLGAAILGLGRPLPGPAHSEVVWSLGLPMWHELASAPPARRATRRHFPDAGYWVLGNDDCHLVVRAGDVGQKGNGGHGHNDALSFELSVQRVPLIVDSGTYLYTANSQARNGFRSTAAHNTIRVDGEEINPIDAAQLFRMRQVANVRCERASAHSVMVSHDGYRRMADAVRHRRTFTFLVATDGIQVIDEIQGSGEHLIEWFVHLAPATTATKLQGSGYLLARNGVSARLTWGPQTDVAVTPQDGWISNQFGVRERALVLIGRTRVLAPMTLEWTVYPAADQGLASAPQRDGAAHIPADAPASGRTGSSRG